MKNNEKTMGQAAWIKLLYLYFRGEHSFSDFSRVEQIFMDFFLPTHIEMVLMI